MFIFLLVKKNRIVGIKLNRKECKAENLKEKTPKIKFTKIQKSWISYREYYRAYRNAKTKEERAKVKKRIFSEKVKLK